MYFGLESIKDVCDVSLVAHPEADPHSPPDVFIELPHGATEQGHLDVAKAWTRQYPGPRHDLFFYANTDQGSPEFAAYFAARITDPSLGLKPMKVLILRALLPRTILDPNRIWAADDDAEAAGLTRGVPNWLTHPEDLAQLRRRYNQYQEQAGRGYASVCGNGGWAFNLHTYGPISVNPEPHEYVVDALERAYHPNTIANYSRRPTIQLITTPPDGANLSDPKLVAAIHNQYDRAGIDISENDPFSLHPATTAHHHAQTWRGRVLTIEISREALAEPFDIFTLMTISPEKVKAMTEPLVQGFARFKTA